MEIEIQEPKSYIREIKISLAYEKFEDEINRVAKQYAKNASISGFRKGKAPLSIVANSFKKEIEEEAQDNLVKNTFITAIKEHNLSPITYADIKSIEKTKKNGRFSFTATFQVIPEFDLATNGIEVTYKIPPVTEDEISKVLLDLQEKYTTLKSVIRASKFGDNVEFDYVVTDNEGKELDKVQGMSIDCSKKGSDASLMSMILGAKSKEKKNGLISYPKEFPVVQLHGKSVQISITMKEIKEKAVPPLDDEFAKIFGLDSLKELKNSIKRQLLIEREEMVTGKATDKMIEKLIEINTFEVPDSLVKFYLKGYSEASRRDSNKEEWNKIAEKRAKMNIILDRIAIRDKIEIPEDELDKIIDKEAAGQSIGKKEFKQYLEKTGEIQDIIQMLKRKKVYEFLKGNFLSKGE